MKGNHRVVLCSLLLAGAIVNTVSACGSGGGPTTLSMPQMRQMLDDVPLPAGGRLTYNYEQPRKGAAAGGSILRRYNYGRADQPLCRRLLSGLENAHYSIDPGDGGHLSTQSCTVDPPNQALTPVSGAVYVRAPKSSALITVDWAADTTISVSIEDS